MEGDLPGQANVNDGPSIFLGASRLVISGGEFNSVGRDYNRITINIYQGVRRRRGNPHESSSALHRGHRNPERGTTPDHIVSVDFSDEEDEECIEESSNAIYDQGVPRHRDDRHESSSTLHRGRRNLRRSTTPNHMVSRDLSDEEDEECIKESSDAIYERQMLLKKYVFFFSSVGT